jgi:hypothetical protein
MPVNVRIMNWNIQQLSWNKIQIPGMAEALAEVVVANNVDVLVIVEVMNVNAEAIMNNLTAAINLRAGAGGNYYWILSRPTAGEHYGFVIHNMNVIRVLGSAPNAAAPEQNEGTELNPFSDLHAQRFSTWPAAFPAAVPAVLPAKPRFGLVDAFATRPRPRGEAKRVRFAGQPLGRGGYSMGRGARLPCLAPLMVKAPGVAGPVTLLPILVCHYAAVWGGRNVLAQEQVGQLKLLHLPQLFSFTEILAPGPPPPKRGYLDVDNAAVPVENIAFTGDFNIDFKVNSGNEAAPFLARVNHNALVVLTPTEQGAGSAAPPAVAGALPAGAAPAVPFAAFPEAPTTSDIVRQALRASTTLNGTILVHYTPPPPEPANTAALREATFDNFFYGGAVMNTALMLAGADSGFVVDVPAAIVQPGGAGLNVAALQAHFAALGTKDAAAAPKLAAAAPPALTVNDRLIGARLLSDHLPVLVEVVCP